MVSLRMLLAGLASTVMLSGSLVGVTSDTTIHSGLTGTAWACMGFVPRGSRPLATVLVLRGRTVVARTQVPSGLVYRIKLAPGTYGATNLPHTGPQSLGYRVIVPAHGWAHQDLLNRCI